MSKTPWGISNSSFSIYYAASLAALCIIAEYGFAHLLFKAAAIKDTAGKVPLIGASGAVAGVIAAYVLLYPRVMVWVLAFRVIPLRINAALALGAWIATQFVMLLIPDKGPVAWWAHIGGIATGATLILFMRRPEVPLFGRQPQPVNDHPSSPKSLV